MIELRCTLDRTRIAPDVATEVGCQLELVPSQGAAAAGSVALTTNLCLVLDCSASMLGAKVEAAISAAKLIVSSIDARHRISVVGFATSHWVVVDNASPAETGRDVINKEIERLRTMIKGSTNLGEGIRRGIKTVQRQQADASVLVVLTDGVADSQADAELASAEANEAGVQVFAVGIGESFRADDLLKVVAPSGGTLLGERAADRLETAFAELLKRIESFVATGVQLTISPAAGVVLGATYKTSPERMLIGDNVERVIVGNLERGIAYSFHVALTPPCAGSGEAEIARATLRYDVPSRGHRGAMTEISIRIAYDARAEAANPEVVRAHARAQLAALVKQLADSETRGDRTKSAELLTLLAERSAAHGNTRLVEALRGLASPIPQGELNALVLAATARDVVEEPRAPEPAAVPETNRPRRTLPTPTRPSAAARPPAENVRPPSPPQPTPAPPPQSTPAPPPQSTPAPPPQSTPAPPPQSTPAPPPQSTPAPPPQ
ncbi:MAG TPA: vWA domain-containing protein, partial [Kofleriaceae bacterium]|nr:vWA domain-containing protein [Kofleriaceae bacterium]